MTRGRILLKWKKASAFHFMFWLCFMMVCIDSLTFSSRTFPVTRKLSSEDEEGAY